jgi:hypothetical protein
MQLAWPFGRLYGRGDCRNCWICALLAVTNLQWVSPALLYSLYKKSSSFTGLRSFFVDDLLCRPSCIAIYVSRSFAVAFLYVHGVLQRRPPLPAYLSRYHAIRYVLRRYFSQFLGSFAKLRKATLSFVMSVRPIVRMEQPGSHWADFYEIWYFSIFRKSVEKIEVSLKS